MGYMIINWDNLKVGQIITRRYTDEQYEIIDLDEHVSGKKWVTLSDESDGSTIMVPLPIFVRNYSI